MKFNSWYIWCYFSLKFIIQRSAVWNFTGQQSSTFLNNKHTDDQAEYDERPHTAHTAYGLTTANSAPDHLQVTQSAWIILENILPLCSIIHYYNNIANDCRTAVAQNIDTVVTSSDNYILQKILMQNDILIYNCEEWSLGIFNFIPQLWLDL